MHWCCTMMIMMSVQRQCTPGRHCGAAGGGRGPLDSLAEELVSIIDIDIGIFDSYGSNKGMHLSRIKFEPSSRRETFSN
jgi:hypothetical protein